MGTIISYVSVQTELFCKLEDPSCIAPLIGEGNGGQNKFVRQVSRLKRDLFRKVLAKKLPGCGTIYCNFPERVYAGGDQIQTCVKRPCRE